MKAMKFIDFLPFVPIRNKNWRHIGPKMVFPMRNNPSRFIDLDNGNPIRIYRRKFIDFRPANLPGMSPVPIIVGNRKDNEVNEPMVSSYFKVKPSGRFFMRNVSWGRDVNWNRDDNNPMSKPGVCMPCLFPWRNVPPDSARRNHRE